MARELHTMIPTGEYQLHAGAKFHTELNTFLDKKFESEMKELRDHCIYKICIDLGLTLARERLWAEEAYAKFIAEYEPHLSGELSAIRQQLWKSKVTEYVLTEKHKFFGEPVGVLQEHFKSQQDYLISEMVAIRLRGDDKYIAAIDPFDDSTKSDAAIAFGFTLLAQKQKP